MAATSWAGRVNLLCGPGGLLPKDCTPTVAVLQECVSATRGSLRQPSELYEAVHASCRGDGASEAQQTATALVLASVVSYDEICMARGTKAMLMRQQQRQQQQHQQRQEAREAAEAGMSAAPQLDARARGYLAQMDALRGDGAIVSWIMELIQEVQTTKPYITKIVKVRARAKRPAWPHLLLRPHTAGSHAVTAAPCRPVHTCNCAAVQAGAAFELAFRAPSSWPIAPLPVRAPRQRREPPPPPEGVNQQWLYRQTHAMGKAICIN